MDGKIIMDILDEIYWKLEVCYGKIFVKYVVLYEKFIIYLFLLNVEKYFGNDYDKIVLGVFCLKNNSILMVLKDCNCIIICIVVLWKFFKDLVYFCFLVFEIFLNENERFFLELFCNEKDLDEFVSFGMMKDEI